MVKRLVWTITGDGLRMSKFAGADTRLVGNRTRIALLIEYVRNARHHARVLAGEADLATMQISFSRQEVRALAALLTRAADEMDNPA